jgi:hypothetical protein
MNPEIQKLITDAIFRASVISGILAALISSFVMLINSIMERRAANKRHKVEIDSQERRNMQSIALSVALEKWKVDFADAVKTRDALVADDLKNRVSGRSRCVEDALGYESIEVAVERIIELINRVAPKAGIQADKK